MSQMYVIHRVDCSDYIQHTYFVGIREGLSDLFTNPPEDVEVTKSVIINPGQFTASMKWKNGVRRYIATPLLKDGTFPTNGRYTTEISCYIE